MHPTLPFKESAKDEEAGSPLLSQTASNSIPYTPDRLEVVDKKSSRLAWAGAITAGAVVFLTGGVATSFIGWILLRRLPMKSVFEPGLLTQVPSASFMVSEGEKFDNDGSSVTRASLWALTISALASKIVASTNSFVMGLVAYRTAGQWLEHSDGDEVARSTENPSPVQYGILVSLLGNPSYASIARAAKYTFRKKQRSAVPRLFVEPLLFALALYMLAHGVGLADLWLHSTARSILIPVITTVTSGQLQPLNSTSHGFTFNQTLCDTSLWMGPGQPCTHSDYGWKPDMSPDARTIGMLVAYNASGAPYRTFALAAENGMAILTPKITPAPKVTSITASGGTAFTFSTLGARASCTYLNNRCSDGGHMITVDSCSSAGWPLLPLNTTADHDPPSDNPAGRAPSDSRLASIRNNSTGWMANNYDWNVQAFPNDTWSPNPATIGIQLYTPSEDTKATAFFTVGALADATGFTFAGCSLEYFNVSATYNPISDTYSLVDATPSTPYFTSVLLEPLISQVADQRLVADLQSSILIGEVDIFEAVLNQDLAQMAVSWPSGMFNPSPAQDLTQIEVQALGVYSAAPVLVITALLYLYALLVLSVFFTSRTFTSYNISVDAYTRKMEAVVLGQKWLTNPIPLVAMAFPGKDGRDGRRSVAARSVEMMDDMRGERLVLGVRANAQGERTFGLTKRGDGLEMRKRAGSV